MTGACGCVMRTFYTATGDEVVHRCDEPRGHKGPHFSRLGSMAWPNLRYGKAS